MQPTTLNSIPIGGSAVILNIGNPPSMRRRLLDLGFIPGTRLTCILKSRRGESAAYLIRETVIALRKEDSALIQVFAVSEQQEQINIDETDAKTSQSQFQQ